MAGIEVARGDGVQKPTKASKSAVERLVMPHFTPENALRLVEAILDEQDRAKLAGKTVCQWCELEFTSHHPGCPILVAESMMADVVEAA